MREKDTIDALARSYAAHNIRTAADVAVYCRPSFWLRLSLAVVLGVLGGLAAWYVVPGVTAGECVAAAGVYTVAALLAGSAFVWVMDRI